ncbi:PLC-like phosphodiesterase, partial [Haematococcus lacustris]
AHRGGCLETGSFIENTMPAFRNSARLGVDLLELDVQLTRDMQVVVFHDTSLGRLAGPAFARLSCRDLDYSQLPHLEMSSQRMAAPCWLGQSQGIPLLEEVFRAFPHIPIQVDVKVDTPGLVEAVHGLVMRFNRRRSVLWGSFRHKVQVQLYETDPHIPLFTSIWRAAFLKAAHAAGTLNQVHIYESALILP